ncbi:MAG: nucleotidyltransferase domain-containing protein [Candidatus Brocadiia bacterium]|nr:MAG: nucleotidyltransferase domain-containing protein [Candidatus Brocadiia bacterium]
MKKSLAHLPKAKQDELKLIVDKIKELAQPCIRKIILFGSYARGDWKDGPHTQGDGEMTIHKKSDYDILIATVDGYTAYDAILCKKVDDACAEMNLSTHVRIIVHPRTFIDAKLSQRQVNFRSFFNPISIQQGLLHEN